MSEQIFKHDMKILYPSSSLMKLTRCELLRLIEEHQNHINCMFCAMYQYCLTLTYLDKINIEYKEKMKKSEKKNDK